MLVIFDCDGVLVDSEPISLRVLRDSIQDLGLDVGDGWVERLKGSALGQVHLAVEDRLGRPLDSAWLDEFQDSRADAFREELRPVLGAAESVRAVRSLGCKICVASQGRLEKMELTLTLTGLADVLGDAGRFSANMVSRPKPAPDLFLLAASESGHDPSDCVVVEDSVLGIEAAKAAAMKTIALAPLTESFRGLKSSETISSMAELPERIQHLQRISES